jgi:hypothetical protein
MLVRCGAVLEEDGIPSHDPGACWQGTTAVRSSIVVVVSAIYASLTLTFALSVFQQDPTDRSDALGRPHSRIEVFSLAQKTILTISFTVFEGFQRYERIISKSFNRPL